MGGSDSDGSSREGPGNVFLVGTGPGDPELLTLKAVRVIEGADLLLYDRLVSNDVLNLVGPDARFLYVGKTAGYHSRTQVVNAFSLSLKFQFFETLICTVHFICFFMYYLGLPVLVSALPQMFCLFYTL